MRAAVRNWLRALPFTVGIALSLIALCYLVRFYDRGLDFDEGDIWTFAALFLIGFPTLIHGINVLARNNEH